MGWRMAGDIYIYIYIYIHWGKFGSRHESLVSLVPKLADLELRKSQVYEPSPAKHRHSFSALRTSSFFRQGQATQILASIDVTQRVLSFQERTSSATAVQTALLSSWSRRLLAECCSKIDTISAWPSDFARSKGVEASSASTSVSAPASTNMRAISGWSFCAAKCRGVIPLSVATSFSAPASNSKRTTLKLLFRTASCSGVQPPSVERLSFSAAKFSKSCTTSTWSRWAAKCKDVLPVLSVLSTSVPARRKRRTSLACPFQAAECIATAPPYIDALSLSAPKASKSWTTSWWPIPDANIRGVSPWSWRSLAAPASSSNRTASTRPFWAA